MSLPPQIANAFALVAAGRASEAVRLLEALAEKGDGPACYQLAEWRREGEHGPRDFAMARALYARSGAAGLIEGARRFVALAAVGIGGPRDWRNALAVLAELAAIDPTAARQKALLARMNLDPQGDPLAVPQGETVCESPRIARFADLFSADECAWLADSAVPLFEPAPTVDERTGELIMNPVRTSETAVFPWVAENPALHALNRRIAAASGTRSEQGEPLQVLRYVFGQEYKPHIDAIPGLRNQRILTMLIWLNEDFEGGETHFLKADLRLRLHRGDAILIDNVDGQGRPDPGAVHAGLPVTRGKKLLASRWIRAFPVKA
jgi:prolyl 4-hydroxylase